MKLTKTTELDRLKMIYPSSAENLILKRCFLQRFPLGLGRIIGGRFSQGTPLFPVLKQAVHQVILRRNTYARSGLQERAGNPGLEDAIPLGLGGTFNVLTF